MDMLFFFSTRSARQLLARWLLFAFLPFALAGCFGGSDDDTAPSITTQPASLTVAEGQTASFAVNAGGTDPLTYQWRKDGTPISGATGASFTTGAAALVDSGALYSVVVGNAAGSVTSLAATLTVGAAVAPSIATPPMATSVVSGQPASFSVVVDGTTPLGYQWTKNGAPIAGATAPSYATPATETGDDGAVFAVVVTNLAGSATSAGATLGVTALSIRPTFDTQPANATVNSGQTASFGVVAAGTAPFDYQWRRNGTPIGGATSAIYTTPATADADTGATFSVIVTNSAGTVTSNAAILTVTALPIVPAITSAPASVTVIAGQAASFHVEATGTAPLRYQWLRDGAGIAGATAATYTLANTRTADSGATFSAIVTNDAGTVTSRAATLTVGAASVAPGIANQPTAMTVTAPATATFSVVATGSAPLAYQWRRNGVTIGGATAASYTTPPTSVAGDNGAQFSVVVSNGTLPNATSANAVLTVRAAPVAPTIATQPASATVTAGATASFSVVANGSAPFAYQWRRNGTAITGATGASYTTPATVAGDSGARFSVVVSNVTAQDATSDDATLTVNSTWTGIRQDGAPFPLSGTLPVAFDAALAVATDAQGSVVIGGYTTGVFISGNDPGAAKPYIAKYSAAGALVWARLVLDAYFGFDLHEAVSGVAIDAGGNIYVTGQTRTTLAGEIAAGDTDVFVAKFDTAGNRLWAHQVGSARPDVPSGIAVDSVGSAYVVGTSDGQLPLQPPPAGNDYFIIKYATDGTRLWIKTFDLGGDDRASGVALDGAGDIFVSGSTAQSSGTFAGTKAFAAKHDNAGNQLWLTLLGNVSFPAVRADAIATSTDGNTVYISGWTYLDFDTPGNPPVAPSCCTAADAFVARLDGGGAIQWAHNLSSLTLSGPRYFDDEAFGIATTPSGSAVFITGYTNGVMPGEASKGAEDAFVARYEADGTRSWVRQLGAGLPSTSGGSQNDRAFGIALDLNGDVFVAGVTHGTFGTPGRNTDRDDWFVLKMKPADGSLY